MITFTFNGQTLQAQDGQTVAAALISNQEKITRYTRFNHKPRGVFCGIGACFDCLITINGEINQRSCLTQVVEGMEVRTQNEQ